MGMHKFLREIKKNNKENIFDSWKYELSNYLDSPQRTLHPYIIITINYCLHFKSLQYRMNSGFKFMYLQWRIMRIVTKDCRRHKCILETVENDSAVLYYSVRPTINGYRF